MGVLLAVSRTGRAILTSRVPQNLPAAPLRGGVQGRVRIDGDGPAYRAEERDVGAAVAISHTGGEWDAARLGDRAGAAGFGGAVVHAAAHPPGIDAIAQFRLGAL